MPNHVYSSMKIAGTPRTIKMFAEKHFTDGDLNLNSFIPMPEELNGTISPVKEPNHELRGKYGADNWYDWNMKNWGTKIDCYDGDMNITMPTVIECKFKTAWALPDLVFKKMAEMYPEVEFHLTCVEEGGYFSGTVNIIDGVVDDSGINDDYEQWMVLATKLMGMDFGADEKEQVQYTLDGLRSGEIVDREMTNKIVLFIDENMDEFIKFSKPK